MVGRSQPCSDLGKDIQGRGNSKFNSHKGQASVWVCLRNIKKASGAGVPGMKKAVVIRSSEGEAAVLTGE